MNAKSRILPHLNSYFLQRKAYEFHRKRIEEIRKSTSRPKLKIQELVEGSEEKQLKEEALPKKYSIHTIQEEIKVELNRRLSPLAKRLRDETQRENNRLIERIHKCASTINRREIEKHRLQNAQIKQRLSRFVYSTESHKTLMKCKHSLSILQKKEREKEASPSLLSGNPSRVRYSRSELSQLQRRGNSQRVSSDYSTDKSSIAKFYLLKHSSKIRQHFQKSDFRTYASSNFQNLKERHWNDSKKRIRTQIRNKSKIFNTEIES